jgi:hypothetical protein
LKRYNFKVNISTLEEYLSWILSILSAIIGLGYLSNFFLIEATGLNYGILFIGCAILFCPPVKAPNWIIFLLTLALVVTV